MTTPDTGIDLSWVTFADNVDDQACVYMECGAQAVCVGVYRVIFGCRHGRFPYCTAHRDLILSHTAQGTDTFRCARMCGPSSLLEFLRMERLG
jgi:hypothetical protein